MATILERNLSLLSIRPGVPIIILCLMASLAIVRAGLFPGTGGDDGEQLIFSQYFQWGYQVRNPPLYTWLVIAVSEITGPTLWVVNIVKFSLLAGMYLFLWQACRLIFQDMRMAALAAASPLLFYYMAWEVVTGFSHTVLVACLYAALFLALARLRVDKTRRLSSYVFLGLVIGLGVQAKYAFWIFLISLLLAAFSDATLRQRLLSPVIVLTLAIATLIATPHYLWLFEQLGVFANTLDDGTILASKASDGGFSLKGLGHGVNAAVGFLSPYWLIALACFPMAFRSSPTAHPWARIIGIQILIVLGGTALGTLISPEFQIRTHYMVVLILFPIWVLLRAEIATPSARRIGVYGGFISLCLLAIPLGMIGKFVFEPLYCGRCQHHIPYTELASSMRDLGFQDGTIIANFIPDPLPGNLRIQFPDARVLSAKHTNIIPPHPNGTKMAAPGQCMVVWSADTSGTPKSPAVSAAKSMLGVRLGNHSPHHLISAPISSLFPWGPGKVVTLGVILTEAQGDCR